MGQRESQGKQIHTISLMNVIHFKVSQRRIIFGLVERRFYFISQWKRTTFTSYVSGIFPSTIHATGVHMSWHIVCYFNPKLVE